MTVINPATARSYYPQRDAIPCGACDKPTPDDRAVLLDQAGDQGENGVCVDCAIALGLPVCQHCGAYEPDATYCPDCEHDLWRDAIYPSRREG